MTALIQDVQRRTNHRPALQRLTPLPVLGGEVIYIGAMVCVDPAGLAVPAADTVGLQFIGLATSGLDNTLGTDGSIAARSERFIEADREAVASYPLSGAAPRPGDDAFAVDDDTVSGATTNSIKVGIFVQPDPLRPGNWFVDHGRA